jgi:hypothetical protein
MLMLCGLALSLAPGSAAEGHWTTAQAYQYGQALMRGYNRVAAHEGAPRGMEWVYGRATGALHLMSLTARKTFESDLDKWALEMQDSNAALVREYVKYNEAFGQGRVWQWTRSFAVKRIGSFTWGGREARRISCRGVWNAKAKYSHGGGYFTDFRCAFWQPDGRWTFRLHVASDDNFLTSDWASGAAGGSSTTPAPAGGCTTQSGTSFTLHSVGCTQAVNVWFAYTRGNPLPQGWSCQPHSCQGPPDFTGLNSSFTWSP